MGLKESTAEKHKQAEKMPYNQLMIEGKFGILQYAEYLKSQYAIFSTIEDNFELPHLTLARKGATLIDLEKTGFTDFTPDAKTQLYCDYLLGLTQDEINAHIYLHYLALMFGGQIIKTKVPSEGTMYDFGPDMMTAAGAIRAIQSDDWADEVNKGFDFMISIFGELHQIIIRQ
jgi:heme oxygenase